MDIYSQKRALLMLLSLLRLLGSCSPAPEPSPLRGEMSGPSLHTASVPVAAGADGPSHSSVINSGQQQSSPATDVLELSSLAADESSAGRPTSHRGDTDKPDSQSERDDTKSVQPGSRHNVSGLSPSPSAHRSVNSKDALAVLQVELSTMSSSSNTAAPSSAIASPIPEMWDLPSASFSPILAMPGSSADMESAEPPISRAVEPNSRPTLRQHIPGSIDEDKADSGASSSEEDQDSEGEGTLERSAAVNETGLRRHGASAADADAQLQHRAATFTVVMCTTVGTIFVALVGIWIYRVRRADRQQMLEDDDGEFTVFSAENQRQTASSARKYAPLH